MRRVRLEERVEVIVTETAVGFSTAVCDHEEELERELGGRHRDRIVMGTIVMEKTCSIIRGVWSVY
jgi:hypothetical protein